MEILNVEYLCMYLHVGELTMMIYIFFFNSPEPKVQVSFLFEVCLLSVVVVIVAVVNFSHFCLFLKNQCANFNQT